MLNDSKNPLPVDQKLTDNDQAVSRAWAAADFPES